MKPIYNLEPNVYKDKKSIFLAGPTHRKPGKHSWREDALWHLKDFKGVVYVPENKGGISPDGWTYSRQVSWECTAMESADIILMWIPRSEELPAKTTNIEFGKYMKSGKIIVGAPKDAPDNEYIFEMSNRLGIYITNSLEDLCKKAMYLTSGSNFKIWFTADTHFGHERTLQMSKRPFNSVKEMDWTLVKNWNTVVKPCDYVFHLGDVGSPEMIQYLSGEITLIRGNYDTDEITSELIKHKEFNLGISNFLFQDEYRLVHMPEEANDPNYFYLFGHIHRVQMIKKNGLNVGVDCHNFYPIDLEAIKYYHNAIKNHYDKNVFMSELGLE